MTMNTMMNNHITEIDRVDESIETQKSINKLIDIYFSQPNVLYNHLFDSYHQFVTEIIPYFLTNESNHFYENVDNNIIYLYGFECSDIKIKIPTFENNNEIKFPSDARKNNLNYFSTVVANVKQFVEIIDTVNDTRTIEYSEKMEKRLPIANIPIMVKSNFCSTVIKKDLHGECKYDPGGYFIVNGQEKVVMSIEKMVDNKILIFTKKDTGNSNNLLHIAQINSRKNDWSDNLQILTIKIKKNGVLTVSTSLQLIDISFFVLMRALGVETDKEIISYITNDLEDNEMLNLIRPNLINNLTDGNEKINTREEAINYMIEKLKRNKRISQTNEDIAKKQKKDILNKIFKNDLLPHLDDDIPKKIVYLGMIVNKLFRVILKRDEPDDRDALYNKRIETPGILLSQLFRQNWKKLLNDVGKSFKKKFSFNTTPINVINQIKPSTIEQGIKTALSTGIWGMNKTKKGVAQSLQRLSWLQGISYLRRIISPSVDDSTIKITSIRQVNPNQIHLLCCLTGDTRILLGNGVDTKLLKDITDKNTVVSLNTETISENSCSIYNIFSRKEKVLNLKLLNGNTVRSTIDHQFFVHNKYGIHKKVVSDLSKYDNFLVKPLQQQLDDNLIRNKIARFYGYYYSTSVLTFNNMRELNLFMDDMSNYCHCSNIVEQSQDNNLYVLSISNVIHADYSNYDICFSGISQWVLCGSDSVKREFLSGYMSNRSVVVTYENGVSHIIHDNIVLKLLNELGIETYNTQIVNTPDNIIKYYELVGMKYHSINNDMLGIISEYYKFIKNDSFKNVSFDYFLNNQTHKYLVIVPIESIEYYGEEEVYDFTVRHFTHNFIANGILSSNCVETPEGAKIGVVKSLSMMSQITMQNISNIDIIKKIVSKEEKITHVFNVNPLHMKNYVKIILNGNILGVCKIKDSIEIFNKLKQMKLNNIIDQYISLFFNYTDKEIKMFYDGGRLIRPLLKVENGKTNLSKEAIAHINTLSKLKDKSKAWIEFVNKFKNVIEYEDIESLNYTMVAEDLKKLIENNLFKSNTPNDGIDGTYLNRYNDHRWLKYTHCELHPWVMLGSIAVNIPFSNHNYGVRNILHFSQAKQSVSIFLSSYKDRMDNTQILYYPQKPLVITQGMKHNHCLDLPYGENAIIAVLSYNGYNQEDSLIFNKSAVDRGLFRGDTIKKYHSEITKNPSTSQDDKFTKPEANEVFSMKNGNYNKLNSNGFVPEETEIDNDDIIIGKISPIQPVGHNNKIYKDNSEIFKSNVKGVVDKVDSNIYNAEGYEMINMRVRLERKPIIGDKFTCYDDSHELLTERGWVNVKDISLEDKIATLNRNTDTLVYQYPLEIQEYDHEGQMYNVESDKVSLNVTMNHRLYVKLYNNFDLVEATYVCGRKAEYKNTISKLEITNNTKYFIYLNKTITYFKLFNGRVNIEKWCKLFGLFLSSGVLFTSDSILMIKYNKSDKEYVYNIVSLLLNELEIEINHKTDNEIVFKCEDMYNFFSLGTVSIDEIFKWVWHLPMNYCRMICSIILRLSKNFNVCCFNKPLADNMQRLFFHASLNFIIKQNKDKYYIVMDNDSPIINEILEMNKSMDKIVPDFKGKVYCVTVPNSIVYVRRNGMCVWCGNSRSGQKGTIGILYEQKDMPFTEDGIVPDIIFNPHGFPSRMSIGQFIEGIASKAAVLSGDFYDGTPFNDHDLEKICDVLEQSGYERYGTETMYCGITGKKMESKIFIVPSYNIRLKHMVLDKIHGRARGPKQALTRQPLEGRSKDGGLKIGEMEKDAMVAHGIGQFLKERMVETSDIYKTHVCDICGRFVSKVINKNHYKCNGCHNTTKISQIVIPYACKLLFQELASVNILPRIFTKSNKYEDEV